MKQKTKTSNKKKQKQKTRKTTKYEIRCLSFETEILNIFPINVNVGPCKMKVNQYIYNWLFSKSELWVWKTVM